MKTDNETKEVIEVMLGSILMMVLSIIICGFTVMYLWNNILPTIFGIRTITLAQAIAIDLLISFVVTTQINDTKWTVSESFVRTLSICLITLLIGWIVIQFI